MLIKKKSGPKTTEMIEADIRYGFNKIISQNNHIYFITINNKTFLTPKELKFSLTNLFFNRIRKDYKYMSNVLNYLFVIEYPEKVSRGNMIFEKIEVHTHIIIETNLTEETLKFYIETIFKKDEVKEKNWYDIQRIDLRNDKTNLVEYFVKQKNLFTDENYNYKIEKLENSNVILDDWI